MDIARLTLDALLQPMGAERFKTEHLGRRHLHLKGDDGRFTEVMTWAHLKALLDMTTIWSEASLQLVLDKEPVPVRSYAQPAPGRDGVQVLRPDPDKVMGHLRQGATLVLNDIDELNPGLKAVARALEEGLGGKVQANLYCSSRRRPGFAAHFDTHDVFAVHVLGEKIWHVYEGVADHPIAHPAFKTFGREHHEKAKGRKLEDVRLTPGDILYLPRGQYHDAVALDGGTVHVAFGVTYPIGLDVVGMLFERMVGESVARRNLPDDEAALQAHLEDLGARMAAVATDPATQAQVRGFQKGFRYPRAGYRMPEVLEEEPSFKVKAAGVRLVQQGGRFGLVKEGSRQAVEVPAAVGPLVAWVLERPVFTRNELQAAFPDRPAPALDQLIRDLANMRLAEPA
jgi:bifunctional lysine-specific demethylase and histidyl-hydroxylase MINA